MRSGIPSRFTVHDRSDAEDFLEGIFSKYKKTHPHPSLPKKGTALNIHSFQVNSQWPLEKVIVDNFPDYQGEEKVLQKLFHHTKCKRSRLECLITTTYCLPCAILCRHPEVGPKIAARFESVLVDEYQDTNPLQSEILMALRPNGLGLTAVGDEAQSDLLFSRSHGSQYS